MINPVTIGNISTAHSNIPAYLRDVYTWAYLTPSLTSYLDSQVIVQLILWGNARRLTNRVLREISPGWTVLQPAAVYGVFSRRLASRLGSNGQLDVRDIAPLQVEITKTKLAGYPQANVALGDAAERPVRKVENEMYKDRILYQYDAVVCFFLLHEVPEEMKHKIVQTLLEEVKNGGKKVVFVDYHQPKFWHPLKYFMKMIFHKLEPFALTLWKHEIRDYAQTGTSKKFCWSKETLFGGLYQVVIATPQEFLK